MLTFIRNALFGEKETRKDPIVWGCMEVKGPVKQVHVQEGAMVTIDPDGNLFKDNQAVGVGKKWRHAQSVCGGDIMAISEDEVYHLTKDEMKPLLSRTVSLACGLEHCVAIDKAGKAFTAALTNWAYERGQLGLGEEGQAFAIRTKPDEVKLCELDSWDLMKGKDKKERQSPDIPAREKVSAVSFREIPENVKFVEAHCGDNHSLLLDRDGGVLVFGCNAQQQLGMKQLISCVSRPYKHDLKAEMVAAGGNNSMVYTKNGDLLVVGEGLQGQLGNGHRRHQQGEWKPVESLSGRHNPDGSLIKPVQMAVGRDHLGVLMDTADPTAGFGYDLRLWGGNQSGQLGNGKRTPATEPTSPANCPPLIYRGGQLQIPQGQNGRPEYQLYLGPQLTILH